MTEITHITYMLKQQITLSFLAFQDPVCVDLNHFEGHHIVKLVWKKVKVCNSVAWTNDHWKTNENFLVWRA